MKKKILGISLLAAMGFSAAASADTLATFSFVDTAGTGSGTLVLDLPGTITSNTFSVGGLSTAQALADIRSLNYTYSDGVKVTMSNFNTSEVFTNASAQIITSGISWATSNASHAGFGSGTVDLITGFKFGGNQSIAGTSTYSVSEALFSAANVGQGNNGITPTTVPASNDAGFWQLTSLAPAPVPLPAALPLLLSGLGLFGLRSRRRG